MLLPYANLQIKHQNPDATMPLILPVHVICNTSDEDLHRNISINSRRPGEWLKQEEAHDAIAIMCGSGPSLRDDIEVVRELRLASKGIIFAMNGAAKFLHENFLIPDYQVIIDPRPQTADLIGPASQHLFASQVHPDCFDKVPQAKLYHLQIEGIDDLLPEYPHPFTLIGGAASVGNTALCVAYALGFRTMHLFGYDSSHKDGQSHAFQQPMNDGDPCAYVKFNGREYLTSLTMKLQAERFQETGRALENAGCKVFVHGTGLLPDMWNTPMEQLSEKEKYERMWSIAGYRQVSPGEDCVAKFIEIVRPNGLVVDFGCGTGRAGLAMKRAGLDVWLTDFASNCRDPEAMHLPFVELDLSEPMHLRAPFGYCTDVMEHIPPEKVEAVIRNVMTAAETVFFQISTVPDMFGAAINQRLHLTVMDHDWWRELFETMGYAVTWEEKQDLASQFVVTRQKTN